MFTFRYVYTNELGTIKTIIFETNEIILNEILTEFGDFLKGCGFSFDGEIVIDNNQQLELPECSE